MTADPAGDRRRAQEAQQLREALAALESRLTVLEARGEYGSVPARGAALRIPDVGGHPALPRVSFWPRLVMSSPASGTTPAVWKLRVRKGRRWAVRDAPAWLEPAGAVEWEWTVQDGHSCYLSFDFATSAWEQASEPAYDASLPTGEGKRVFHICTTVIRADGLAYLVMGEPGDAVVFVPSNELPLPVGGAASAGDDLEVSRRKHVHPLLDEGGAAPMFDDLEACTSNDWTHVLGMKLVDGHWVPCLIEARNLCSKCCLYYAYEVWAYQNADCSDAGALLHECAVECLTDAEAAEYLDVCILEQDPGATWAAIKNLKIAGPFATYAEAEAACPPPA